MYLFFDTETTGIPRNYRAPVSDLANWPRVVQLAFLQTDAAGVHLISHQFVIKPEGFSIPADAAKIHGITTEYAMAHGVPLREALDQFMVCLRAAKTLVAHNMSYDENVLGAEFLRANLANPLPQANRVCTMQSSTNFCAIPNKFGKFKWPTLAELHTKLFQADFKDAHSALPDVHACAKCFFALKSGGIIRA